MGRVISLRLNRLFGQVVSDFVIHRQVFLHEVFGHHTLFDVAEVVSLTRVNQSLTVRETVLRDLPLAARLRKFL